MSHLSQTIFPSKGQNTTLYCLELYPRLNHNPTSNYSFSKCPQYFPPNMIIQLLPCPVLFPYQTILQHYLYSRDLLKKKL